MFVEYRVNLNQLYSDKFSKQTKLTLIVYRLAGCYSIQSSYIVVCYNNGLIILLEWITQDSSSSCLVSFWDFYYLKFDEL